MSVGTFEVKVVLSALNPNVIVKLLYGDALVDDVAMFEPGGEQKDESFSMDKLNRYLLIHFDTTAIKVIN